MYPGKFLKEHWALIGIIAIGIVFRFALITTLPGGLFPDEAANGLDVNSILSGDVKPFYERGNGREALFFYFLAGSVALFGRGPWQHHIVSAGFGLAAVIAGYFLTKRLFGKNIALLASLFFAVSSYAVTISRTAFRANLVPLFTTLALLFMVKLWQESEPRKRNWAAVLAGVSFALGFYTYISFRMMIPLLLAYTIAILIAYRGRIREFFRQYWKPKLASGIAFLVTIFPLAYYFASHPGSFVGRAGHVSIFSPDLNGGDLIGTFLAVFKKTILAFFTQGDVNWRHNVSEAPLLSPALSPFFAIGLVIFSVSIIILLKQAWQKKLEEQTIYRALVGSWFTLMLVPEITTAEGIPHGLRLIGVMPAIFIIPAWVIARLWEILKKDRFFLPILQKSVATVFFITLIAYNAFLYFGVARGSEDYYYAFRSDLTEASRYLNTRALKNKTYLSLDKFSVQTVDYLTTELNQPYTLLDPAHTYEVKLKRGDQVVFTMSTLYDRIKFVEAHPDAKLVQTSQNQFSELIMVVYEKP